MMLNRITAALICSFVFAAPAFPAQMIRGIDGDTAVILDGDKEIRCRMACIDAPEMSQPFGKDSKKHLYDLLNGKQLILESKGKDLYGRSLMLIFESGTNINVKMVSDGFAWAYKKKRGEYKEAQDEACREHRGIWTEGEPEPPWEYRKRKRSIKSIWPTQWIIKNLPADLNIC